MPILLRDFGLSGIDMEIFLARLAVIHEAEIAAAERRSEKGG
jgi:hypothetical protein